MRWPAMEFSLRVKLVLSYLGVALGAILLLIVVISLAVQNYFNTVQHDQLLTRTNFLAQEVGQLYYQRGESWIGLDRLTDESPDLFVVIDTNQQIHSARPPDFVNLSPNDFPALNSALLQALTTGKTVTGSLQGTPGDKSVFSGLYISVPIYDNGHTGGKIIGALLVAQPDKYPQGFAPGDVLGTLDTVILITGAAIALLVIVFSIFMTRRL